MTRRKQKACQDWSVGRGEITVKVGYYAVKTKWKRKAVRERLIYGDELENAIALRTLAFGLEKDAAALTLYGNGRLEFAYRDVIASLLGQ